MIRNYMVVGIAALLLCFVSCKDDDGWEGSDDRSQDARRYVLNAFEGIREYFWTLEDCTAPVKQIDNKIEWLEVTDEGMGDKGRMFKASYVREMPKGFRKDSLMIHLEDSRAINLVVCAYGELTPSSDNSGDYTDFNKEWWKQQSILYKNTTYLNGAIQEVSRPIPTPWAHSTLSNLPSVVYENDVLSVENGWVMALNMFEVERDGAPESQPYFVLYNKYSGVARVFYYQMERPLTAGEFSFLLTPLDGQDAPKYLYHNLQFGIPDSHGELLTADFIQHVTPYQNIRTLSQGWTAFDIDMSCYSVSGRNGFRGGARMNLNGSTVTSLDIQLEGGMKGTSGGDIEMTSTSSMCSVNGMNCLDQMNSATGRFGDILSAFSSGNYLKGLALGGMSLFNFAKAQTGNAKDEYTGTGKSSGSINMNFSGTLELGGKITGNISSVIEPLEVSYQAFSKTDVFGTGVWSLQSDPIVYVLEGHLLGDTEELACTVDKEGYVYGNDDPASLNLRMVNYLDPESVKVNINPNIFKEVKQVEVFFTYGVYPNLPHGHTATYRERLDGLKPEVPVFLDRKIYKEGHVYKSFQDKPGIFFHEYYAEDDTFDDGNVAKRGFYKQKGADYRYWGKPSIDLTQVDLGVNDLNFFVEQPLLCYPTTWDKGVGKFYDPEAPDFVVCVCVRIDYINEDGNYCKGVYSKRFVPRVKVLKASEMKDKKKCLEDYATRVRAGKPEQQTGNIRIVHKNTDKAAERAAKLLDFIIKDKQE